MPSDRRLPSRSGTWLVVVAALATAGPAAAAGDIYGYTDDAGVTHLSNVPDQEPYRLVLRDPASYRVRASTGYRLNGGAGPLPGNAAFADEITIAADANGLDPALVNAVIAVESNHNPAALSPKGAMGLMQLMPDTGRRFGVTDPWHPEQNIRAGARYLSELLARFDNDLPLALAAYNAGEQTVLRYGRRVPPYAETRSYVKRVMAIYQRSAAAPRTSPPGSRRQGTM